MFLLYGKSVFAHQKLASWKRHHENNKNKIESSENLSKILIFAWQYLQAEIPMTQKYINAVLHSTFLAKLGGIYAL